MAKRPVSGKRGKLEGELEPLSGPAKGVSGKARKPRAKPKSDPQVADKPKRVRKKPAAAKVESAPVPASVVEAPETAQIAPENPPVLTPVVAPVPAPIETPAEVPAEPPAKAAAVAQEDDLPHGLSPVDLLVPAEGEQPGLGWMTQVIVLSSLLLVLFNSFAIDKWARSLPVNEYSGQIIDAADGWHRAMDSIDFNLPLETGRSAWHWVKDLQWPGAGEEDAGTPAGDGADAAEGAG